MVSLFIFVGMLAAAVLFYALAVSTRKQYRCPKCGEKVTVEQMKASRCSMCGAPLDEEGEQR